MPKFAEVPKPLRYTIIALYAQLALGLVYFLLTYDAIVAEIPQRNPDLTGDQVRQISQSLILAQCFNTLIYAVIYYLLFLRKNWARILYLVLTVAGLPFLYQAIPRSLENPIAGLVHFITIGISVGAIYVLFFTSAKEYFRKQRHEDEAEVVKTPDHLLK